MMKQQTTDICIVGGGLAGLVLAIALSDLPLTITVLEAKPYPETAENPDESKALALTYQTQRILNDLSIWSYVSAFSAAIQNVHVSEQGRFGQCLLRAEDLDLPFLGQLVPAAILYEALLQVVNERSNIQLLHSAKITELNHSRRTLQFKQVDSQQIELNYKLLMAADGADSFVCQQLRIATEKRDYQQSALVSRLHISRDHHQTAYQRFTEAGTLALLPVSKKRCALIISADNEQIEQWQSLDDSHFLEKLQALLGSRVGRLSDLTRRVVFPLTQVRAQQQIIDGAVIIGNAAHLLHPVAAQGFNLSLQDIVVLQESLQQACNAGQALDDFTILQGYLAKRESAQHKVAHMTDSIVGAFSSERAMIRSLRHLGLLGLAYCPFAKRAFTRQAAGLSG